MLISNRYEIFCEYLLCQQIQITRRILKKWIFCAHVNDGSIEHDADQIRNFRANESIHHQFSKQKIKKANRIIALLLFSLSVIPLRLTLSLSVSIFLIRCDNSPVKHPSWQDSSDFDERKWTCYQTPISDRNKARQTTNRCHKRATLALSRAIINFWSREIR